MPQPTEVTNADTPVGVDLHRVLYIGLNLASRLGDLHIGGQVHGAVSPAAVDIADDDSVYLLPAADCPTPLAPYLAREMTGADSSPSVPADIAGLGATLAALALGRPPEHTPSGALDVYGHGLDVGLSNVLDVAAAPDPADRYESAAEMISELRRIESRHQFIPAVVRPVGHASPAGPPVPGMPPSSKHRAMVARSVAAILLLVGVDVNHRDPAPQAAAASEVVVATAAPVPSSTTTTRVDVTAAPRPGNLPAEASAPAERVAATTVPLSTVPLSTVPLETTQPSTIPSSRTTIPATTLPSSTEPGTSAPTPATTPTVGETVPATNAPTTPTAPVVAPTSTAPVGPPATIAPTTTSAVTTTTGPATTTTTTPPSTTVRPKPNSKPPLVGDIRGWRNPGDEGTWNFSAPDADRCSVAYWELNGPVSTTKQKDPRTAPEATKGCWDDPISFDTHYSNLPLPVGTYSLRLTLTNWKTGLSASNSISFTVE